MMKEWFFGRGGRGRGGDQKGTIRSFFWDFLVLFLLLTINFFDSLGWTERLVFPPYFKHIIFLGLIYSTLTLSLNIIAGFIGQISLGHSAFYGFGAMTSAVLTLYYHIPYWAAFLMAGLFTGLVGIPLGLPALRIRGHFLVVVTYGFAEVLRIITLNSEFTGGPAGLPGLQPPSLLGKAFNDYGPTGKEAYIIAALLLLLSLVFLVHRVNKSRVGLAWGAIRDDELAASAMGINVAYYKLLAFTLAAIFAGLAGSLYAHYSAFFSSEIMSSNESILILTMVVVGGVRSIPGSILGAFLLVLAPEGLHYLKDWLGLTFDPWQVLYGLLLIIMMRFRPQGIMGKDASWWIWRRDSRQAKLSLRKGKKGVLPT